MFPTPMLQPSILIPFLSNHYATLSPLTVPIITCPPPVIKTFRLLNKIDLNSFRTDLLQSAIFSDPQATLPSLCTQIHSVLTALLDKHAPLLSRSFPDRKTKPFITPAIRTAKRLRSKLETVNRRTNSPLDHHAFKLQSKTLSCLITREKNSFYRSKIAENKNSSRRLWATFNSLLHRKPSPSLPP